MLVLWSCYAPFFFPKILPFATHIHLPQLNFSVINYWKYIPTKTKYNNYNKRFALDQLKIELCALMVNRNLCSALCYFPKLVIRSNQIKLPIASSVYYIVSRMFWPFCKVLFSCTGMQNAKKKNASQELISYHLPWKRQSTYNFRNVRTS